MRRRAESDPETECSSVGSLEEAATNPVPYWMEITVTMGRDSMDRTICVKKVGAEQGRSHKLILEGVLHFGGFAFYLVIFSYNFRLL